MPKRNQAKNSRAPKYPGLYERIQQALGAQNQSEVAEIIGVTPSSVCGWKVRGFVSVDSLLKIAQLSNTSINWLLTGRGPQYVLPIRTTETPPPPLSQTCGTDNDTDDSALSGKRPNEAQQNRRAVSIKEFHALRTRLLEIESVLARAASGWRNLSDANTAMVGDVAHTTAVGAPAARPSTPVELGPLIIEFGCEAELVALAKDLCDLFDQGIGNLELVLRIIKRLRPSDKQPSSIQTLQTKTTSDTTAR